MLLLEEMEALWKNERDEKEMENEDEKRRHKVPIRMRFEEESEHGGTYFLHWIVQRMHQSIYITVYT